MKTAILLFTVHQFLIIYLIVLILLYVVHRKCFVARTEQSYLYFSIIFDRPSPSDPSVSDPPGCRGYADLRCCALVWREPGP